MALKILLFVIFNPNLQNRISIASGTLLIERNALPVFSKALFHFGSLVSLKLKPQTDLWFQQSLQKQFDSANIKFEAQAEVKNIQLKIRLQTQYCNLFSNYACRVEDLVSKGRPEFDTEKRVVKKSLFSFKVSHSK